MNTSISVSEASLNFKLYLSDYLIWYLLNFKVYAKTTKGSGGVSPPVIKASFSYTVVWFLSFIRFTLHINFIICILNIIYKI